METKQSASWDAQFAEHTCGQMSLIAYVILNAHLPAQSCYLGGDQASVQFRRQIEQFCFGIPHLPVYWALVISDNNASASVEVQCLDTTQLTGKPTLVLLEDDGRSVVAATSNASKSSKVDVRVCEK
jgi:hypothetical protein